MRRTHCCAGRSWNRFQGREADERGEHERPGAKLGREARRASVVSSACFDFACLNKLACCRLLSLVPRWLPHGRRQGLEWIACNPRRNDRKLGSFKINLVTGRWADFATGDKGGDPISLLAFVRGVSQGEAARLLRRELGLRP